MARREFDAHFEKVLCEGDEDLIRMIRHSYRGESFRECRCPKCKEVFG